MGFSPRALFAGLSIVAWCGLTSPSHAEKQSFLDPHAGFLFGAGTYFHPIPNQNAFDPVPELASDGTTVTGSKSSTLLPLRMGIYKELPLKTFVEFYGRYTMNLAKPWAAAGTHNGTGSTTWSSYGGGANIGFGLKTWPHYRFQFVGNAEYIFQKALVAMQTNESGPEELNVKVSSTLLGAGFRFETGTLDNWVFSLFGGYQYGLSAYWSAASPKSLFGTSQTGLLANPSNGNKILAQHGGVLVEATLKLNFY